MSLVNTFVSARTYNSLPHISQNFHIPSKKLDDIRDLGDLLSRYRMPLTMGIRLVYRRFEIHESEVMAFKTIALPSYGKLQILRPVLKLGKTKLFPVHYFVDESGNFQAYEYSEVQPKIPKCGNFEDFLSAFRDIVISRGLQLQVGLKIDCVTADIVQDLDTSIVESWGPMVTETGFPEMRGTLFLPQGMPMPPGDYDVASTEWHTISSWEGSEYAPADSLNSRTRHSPRKAHQNHNNVGRNDTVKRVLPFDGRIVEAGTPFHSLLCWIVELW